MPLTVDLFGDDPKQNGKMFIGSDHILFFFPYHDDKTHQQAKNNRVRFLNTITTPKEILSPEHFMIGKEDPYRHFVLAHKSEDDKDAPHIHVRLKTKVSMDHIKILLNQNIEGIEDFLNEECRQELMSISEQYLKSLEDSEEMKACEQAYLDEKKWMLEEYTKQLPKTEVEIKIKEEAIMPPLLNSKEDYNPKPEKPYVSKVKERGLKIGFFDEAKPVSVTSKTKEVISAAPKPASIPEPFISQDKKIKRGESSTEPKLKDRGLARGFLLS